MKWLDIWALCKSFAPDPDFSLESVFYFSAFAGWRPESYRRHQAFVSALQARGVTAGMGEFKEKDRECYSCGARWKDHEEKETDVNIALYLYREAVRDGYDLALVVSQDSDLAPSIRMVRSDFPMKVVRILTPVGRVVRRNTIRRHRTGRLHAFVRTRIERGVYARA